MKILFVDHQGRCTEEGTVVGHSNKALQEYAQLLNEDKEISVAASPCVINGIECHQFQEEIKLRYNIYARPNTRLWERIANKGKEFVNIWKAMHLPYSNIWFYNADFYLFLYFFLLGNRGKNIYCLICYQNYDSSMKGKIKRYVYLKAFAKFKGVLHTQKSMDIVHRKCLYIPDYVYHPEIYSRYAESAKEEKVLCVGTMGASKKLEELVRVFNQLDYPLEIAGKFYDEGRFNRLVDMANANVSLQNRILSSDEYYNLLGSAKYAIMPYDAKEYLHRTSGVLLESIFCGTVPIAPRELLLENGIEGIGYIELSELLTIDFQSSAEEMQAYMLEFVSQNYQYDNIKKKLNAFFDTNKNG